MVKTLLIIAGIAVGAVALFVVETVRGILSHHTNKKKQRMYLEMEHDILSSNARAFLAEYEMLRQAMKSMDMDEQERTFR